MGQQTKTSSRDVLETAYRAAVAMSASAQIETAAPPEDRAVTNDTQTERRTSSDLKPRTVQKESTSSARAFKQPFSPRLDTEGSPKAVQPVTKSGPMSERNTGAVDAEGLIWVDESQGTAYSVRCVLGSETLQAVGSSLYRCMLQCFPLRTMCPPGYQLLFFFTPYSCGVALQARLPNRCTRCPRLRFRVGVWPNLESNATRRRTGGSQTST